MDHPTGSRSRSRSPKDRASNQPGTSSSSPQNSSHVPHVPILPMKQDTDDSYWDSDATQEYKHLLAKQCHFAEKDFVQLLQ
eukprot:6741852-Karenia_brevis.AAC.1